MTSQIEMFDCCWSRFDCTDFNTCHFIWTAGRFQTTLFRRSLGFGGADLKGPPIPPQFWGVDKIVACVFTGPCLRKWSGGILDVKFFLSVHSSTLGQNDLWLNEERTNLSEFGRWWIVQTAQWRKTQPPAEKDAEFSFQLQHVHLWQFDSVAVHVMSCRWNQFRKFQFEFSFRYCRKLLALRRSDDCVLTESLETSPSLPTPRGM